jgi:hypothetical protein
MRSGYGQRRQRFLLLSQDDNILFSYKDGAQPAQSALPSFGSPKKYERSTGSLEKSASGRASFTGSSALRRIASSING